MILIHSPTVITNRRIVLRQTIITYFYRPTEGDDDRERGFSLGARLPSILIGLRNVNAGVVVLDDRVVFDAHFGQAVRAVLAHANAVAPAAAGECVA